MSDNTQAKNSSQSQDLQNDKKEVLPQEVVKKSIIDLKKIVVENGSQKEVIQNPNAAPGTPSIQVLEDQNGNDKGQGGFDEAVSQQQQEDQSQSRLTQQRNSLNINFTSASQFSPRKGEHGSSMSPKRRIQGSNTPCMTPLPDIKVQRSKFDISQTQFFITNINAFRGLESFPKINELHSQISTIIEDLEGRVDTVVERHEAEFLFAYRNHMTKIKQEMVDMKKQAEEQEKRLNDNDRVAGLERQIVWLRDECLNLYKILGKKKDDLSARERNIRDLQRDNQHLQNQIKELMKKNKLMQMKIPTQGITNPTQYNMSNNTQQSMIGLTDQIMNLQSTQHSPKANQQEINLQQQDEVINSQNQTLEEKVSPQHQSVQQEDEMYITQNYQLYSQQQPNQSTTQPSPSHFSSKRASLQPQNQIHMTQNGQQAVGFEQIITKQQIQMLEEANPEFGSQIISLVKRNIEGEISVAQLIHEISQYCKMNYDKKQKQYKQVKDKLDKTMKEKLKMGMARSDLESFFLECVETARKQIIKRKYVAGGVNQPVKGMGASQSNQNGIFQSPPTTRNMGEFIESIKDYKVFRNEDKVKILELLLSHEKLMMFLYQKIFPTHFNLHLQNALENQEEVPLYLRPQKNQQLGAKYININDNSIISNNKNNENYLDLLTEEDPSVQSYQDNIIYQNINSKNLEQQTKLPSISESYSHQPFTNLYSVNLKKKRNSVDQRSAYDSTNNNSLQEYSQGAAKYSVQVSKLGTLSNKYSHQRNSSLRNSYRSGSNYDASSDLRNKSVSKNMENNSFEDSKNAAYNIRTDLYQQLAGSDVKKQTPKINYSGQKTKPNTQQNLSATSPLTNSNSQENRIIPDKLNVVNGKLVFKNI